MRSTASLLFILLVLGVAAPAFAATPDLVRTPAAGDARTRAPLPNAQVSLPPHVNVTCDNVSLPCSAGDFDGSTALGGGDLSLWLKVFFAGAPYPPAYDLDGSGDVSARDLAIWLCLYFNC